VRLIESAPWPPARQFACARPRWRWRRAGRRRRLWARCRPLRTHRRRTDRRNRDCASM